MKPCVLKSPDLVYLIQALDTRYITSCRNYCNFEMTTHAILLGAVNTLGVGTIALAMTKHSAMNLKWSGRPTSCNSQKSRSSQVVIISSTRK